MVFLLKQTGQLKLAPCMTVDRSKTLSEMIGCASVAAAPKEEEYNQQPTAIWDRPA